MPPNSLWKGHLKLSLVSVPVRAYSGAAPDGGEIHFNQLHSKCHSRIKHVKTCPVHGPVPVSEIVSGYEFEKDHYVVVDKAELKALQSEKDHGIEIESFLPADSIDPIHFSGKTYYLVPDGKVAEKPYALIYKSLKAQHMQALAKVVLSSREQLVAVRPVRQLLALVTLHHNAELKEAPEFDSDRLAKDVSREELKLTHTLIQAFQRDEPSLDQYPDRYAEDLIQLIQAKVKGEAVTVPREPEHPQIINLMDALRRSVAQSSKSSKRRDEGGGKNHRTQRSAARSKPSQSSKSRKSG